MPRGGFPRETGRRGGDGAGGKDACGEGAGWGRTWDMKTAMTMLATMAAACGMAWGATVGTDPTRADALVDWEPSGVWDVSAGYVHGTRPVEERGIETDFTSERYVAEVGWWPAGWLRLGVFGGAARARWEGRMGDDGRVGWGGGARATACLWQVPRDGVWAFTVKAEGSLSGWTSGDEDEGAGLVEWLEWEAVVPFEYHVSLTHNGRDADIRDFHSLSVWAGPAFGGVEGTWKRSGAKEDFSATDEAGVAGGVELWLLERLRFWGRVDWFGDATWAVGGTFEF